MASVDIIVRAKDGKELTSKCLSSLSSTSDETSVRVILVQSGSDVVPHDAVDDNVLYFHSKDAVGAVSATNIGLGVSFAYRDSDYVLILDNDTRIPDGDSTWLKRMIGELEKYPGTACVGATSGFVSPPQHILAAPETYTADWGDENRSGVKDVPPATLFVSFAVLFQKSVLREIGLWDARYDPGNFEDSDYAIKCRLAGYELRVAHSVYIHHEGHQTFGDDMPKLMTENQQKFAEKWGLGQLWDLGVVPSKDMAILCGRQAGIVREE